MKNKVQIIILGIGFVSFIAWNIIMAREDNKENLSYAFNGVVEKVSYDKKGIPSVIVLQKRYYLSGGWNFEHLIEKGDSLRKKEGEKVVKLLKKTGKFIYSKIEVFFYCIHYK